MDFQFLLLDQPGIAYIFMAIFGLAFGSFATLVSYRLPRGEPVLFGRSRCPSCKKHLGLPDLFPVFSWLMTGGKCRHCGAKVSARYASIELATSVSFVINYAFWGPVFETVILCLLSTSLIIIIVTDLEFTIIPDQLQIFMFLLGVVYQVLFQHDYEQILFGPLIGVGFAWALRAVFYLWKKRESLGMGDVKFMAVVGIFLPEQTIISFLFLSGMLGIITSIIWSASRKGKEFPFGPALAVSLYISMLYAGLDKHIVTWFADMFYR